MWLRGGLASLVCACAAAAPTPAPSSAEVTIAYVFSAMFLDGLDCTQYYEFTYLENDNAFAAALVAVLGDYIDSIHDVREIRLCAFSHYVDFTLAVDFEFAGYEQDDGQWNIVPDLIPAFQAAVADGSFRERRARDQRGARPGRRRARGRERERRRLGRGDRRRDVRAHDRDARARLVRGRRGRGRRRARRRRGHVRHPEASP